MHLFFLAETPPAPDLDAVDRNSKASEAWSLTDGIFYLHAPEGIGRSKLAAGVEKIMGVGATARNWRTVRKLLALASEA